MKKLNYLIPVLFFLFISMSAFSSNPEKNLIGEWKFEVTEAPYEYQKGKLVFERSNEDIKGKVIFDRAGNVSISNIEIEAESEKITLTLYVEGTRVKVIGTIDEDKFSGFSKAGYEGKMDFLAEKVAN